MAGRYPAIPGWRYMLAFVDGETGRTASGLGQLDIAAQAVCITPIIDNGTSPLLAINDVLNRAASPNISLLMKKEASEWESRGEWSQ